MKKGSKDGEVPVKDNARDVRERYIFKMKGTVKLSKTLKTTRGFGQRKCFWFWSEISH